MLSRDPVSAVAFLGGVARVRDVRALGPSKDATRRAVIDGRLSRPRYGVVSLPDLPLALRRAAEAGGALAALSAADHYGLWTPPHRLLDVSVRRDRHGARAVAPDGVRFLFDAQQLEASEQFLVSLETCVAQSIRQLPADQAVALLDSALHRQSGRVSLEHLRTRIPQRFHHVLDSADGRAEAGAETLARVRLARVGIAARPQVWITGGIRVDLLIDDRLVLEIGSKEFHASPEAYEADHQRATTLLMLGCEVLEFTTSQVMDDWDDVQSVIIERATRQRNAAAAPIPRPKRQP